MTARDEKPNLRICAVLAFAGVALGLSLGCAHRPSPEHRTINTDRYELSVQRGGMVDVSLSGGTPLFNNVRPAVWLEGEDEPTPFRLDGEDTMREAVDDALGMGQGLYFLSREGEWRLQAYPTHPFLTAQVTYHNTSDEPVRVKALMPWAIRQPDEGRFEFGAARGNIEFFQPHPLDDGASRMSAEKSHSAWHTLVHDSATGQSVLAGFLTHNTAENEVLFDEREPENERRFGLFQAISRFDPPIELQPDETLTSERFFLAVSETEPYRALERFANATAVTNAVRPDDSFRPHALNVWPESVGRTLSADDILAEARLVAERLQRFGWNAFLVPRGWERRTGDWTPDSERFPDGLAPVAQELRQLGLQPGLAIEPLIVHEESVLGETHPEWLAAPKPAYADKLNAGERILDITAPGALDYLRSQIVEISYDWRFNLLRSETWLEPLKWAEALSDDSRTRTEWANHTAQTLRQAAGRNTYIIAGGASPASAMGIRGMSMTADQGGEDTPFSAIQSAVNLAAQRYYLSPYLWQPSLTPPRGGEDPDPSLTPHWLTASALSGGTLSVGARFSELDERGWAALRKLVPSHGRPARPVDLFTEPHPHVWSLPVESQVGRWWIVGVFNWNTEQETTVPLYLEPLGMSSRDYYTVYDIWEDVYLGTAERMLNVTLPPGGVHLLAFRTYRERPMLVATDRHFTQGAVGFRDLAWDPGTRTLSGMFLAHEGEAVTLRVLAPPDQVLANARVDTGQVSPYREGRVWAIEIEPAQTGPVHWETAFAPAPAPEVDIEEEEREPIEEFEEFF